MSNSWKATPISKPTPLSVEQFGDQDDLPNQRKTGSRAAAIIGRQLRQYNVPQRPQPVIANTVAISSSAASSARVPRAPSRQRWAAC